MLRGKAEGIGGRPEYQGTEIERQGACRRQATGRKDEYGQPVFHSEDSGQDPVGFEGQGTGDR